VRCLPAGETGRHVLAALLVDEAGWPGHWQVDAGRLSDTVHSSSAAAAATAAAAAAASRDEMTLCWCAC